MLPPVFSQVKQIHSPRHRAARASKRTRSAQAHPANCHDTAGVNARGLRESGIVLHQTCPLAHARLCDAAAATEGGVRK